MGCSGDDLIGDQDRCADLDPVIKLLHGGIIQGNAAARPILRSAVRPRRFLPMNVDLAAEPGALRGFS
jgi:hypothetical protein